MTKQQIRAIHWADITAERIIKLHGDKDQYVLATGITPSGVIHIGNFRETITVDLIARALRDRGKKVRFIFSYDDYDTFRKVPLNLPKRDELEKYLFQPIIDTPDPFDQHSSYAAHHEHNYNIQLPRVGIAFDETISQSQKYRNGDYKNQIKEVLGKKDIIIKILDKHRTTPHKEGWLPVSIYCAECNKDKLKNVTFDGNSLLSYECELCGHKGAEDIDKTSRVKLPWRVDWPMRWVYEGVDFEPGGKDHSSEGGSFSTAKEIVKEVFSKEPPLYVQYDFVSIKGGKGKMSSSSGEVVTISDVLDVYEPEMLRWIFASYKTNVDFSISFDLDVIKLYEDFDRMERLAYGAAGAEKKVAMAKRVYELSQIEERPEAMPFQPSFRHLCNILQINDLDIEKAKLFYKDEIKNSRDERRFNERSKCALFWIQNYAPEEFKFQVLTNPSPITVEEKPRKVIMKLKEYLEKEWNNIETDKELHGKICEYIKDEEIEAKDVYSVLYKILIGKEKGPKLAGFIRTIGKERVLKLLSF